MSVEAEAGAAGDVDSVVGDDDDCHASVVTQTMSSYGSGMLGPSLRRPRHERIVRELSRKRELCWG